MRFVKGTALAVPKESLESGALAPEGANTSYWKILQKTRSKEYRHTDTLKRFPFREIFAAVKGSNAGFSTSLRFGRNDEIMGTHKISNFVRRIHRYFLKRWI